MNKANSMKDLRQNFPQFLTKKDFKSNKTFSKKKYSPHK